MITALSLGNDGFQIEVTTYFFATLAFTFLFIGAVCYVVFRSESLDLKLHQLSRDFEGKLDEKSREIRDSTDEALAKLGLRDFQVKESMKALQKNVETLNVEVRKSMENNEKTLEKVQKKVLEVKRKIDKIETAQKELPRLRSKLQAIEIMQKDLRSIQSIVENINSVPKPYLSSTDEIKVLDGKVLKRGTIRRLRANEIETIGDLLLKSPLEIASTKAMSTDEAKSLQSITQLLTVPGIQHENAVLLVKSGVSSKQELALQDTFDLSAKVSKTAQLYVEKGKIKGNEKPTLEEVASWIKWAKTQ